MATTQEMATHHESHVKEWNDKCTKFETLLSTHTLKSKDASHNVGLLEGRLTTLEKEVMLEEQDITSLSCYLVS
jgi:hypothetical protein